MQHHSLFLLLLAFFLPQSFLMGESATPHPKKSVPEIVKLFDEKQKSINPLVESLDSIRAKPGVTQIKNDSYQELYRLDDKTSGTYTYTFAGNDGKPRSLRSIELEKADGSGFNADFLNGKMIGFSDRHFSGVLLAWWPDTLKPWYYYEMKPTTFLAFREVRWDRADKVSADTYSEDGNIPCKGGGGEIAYVYGQDKPYAVKTPVPADEVERRKQEILAKKAAQKAEPDFEFEARDVAIARLQKEMAEHPTDPDNFFKEYDIACRYLHKLERSKGELPDFPKAKETIFHCFEAYPKHANNLQMLQLKKYLGDVYRTTQETDKAIETYNAVINADPKSIVVYFPNTGVQTGERAESAIGTIRWAAIQSLTGITHSDKGGVAAVKALLEKHKDDQLFQSTAQGMLNRYVQSDESDAKRDKEEEEKIRSIMAAETSKTLTTTTSLTNKPTNR